MWPWPKPAKGKQYSLYQSEIRSLYPEQGLSDGVIDFFARFVQHILAILSKAYLFL